MNINISLVHEILCKKFMYPLFISTWLWKITHLSEVKHHKSSISGQFSIAMLHNQRVKVSDGVISTNVYVYIYIIIYLIVYTIIYITYCILYVMLVVGLRVNFLAIHATVIVLYEWNVSCQMARETTHCFDWLVGIRGCFFPVL